MSYGDVLEFLYLSLIQSCENTYFYNQHGCIVAIKRQKQLSNIISIGKV